MYLNFEDYTDLGGELLQSDFEKLLLKVETEIDYYTFDRILNDLNKVDELEDLTYCYRLKKLTFLLIANLQRYENSQDNSDYGQTVASKSNNGISVTYTTTSSDKLKDLYEDRVFETIQKFLLREVDSEGTPLLYRGLL